MKYTANGLERHIRSSPLSMHHYYSFPFCSAQGELYCGKQKASTQQCCSCNHTSVSWDCNCRMESQGVNYTPQKRSSAEQERAKAAAAKLSGLLILGLYDSHSDGAGLFPVVPTNRDKRHQAETEAQEAHRSGTREPVNW